MTDKLVDIFIILYNFFNPASSLEFFLNMAFIICELRCPAPEQSENKCNSRSTSLNSECQGLKRMFRIIETKDQSAEPKEKVNPSGKGNN